MEGKRISYISSNKFSQNIFKTAWTTDGENKKNKRDFLLSAWRLFKIHFLYCCRTTTLHCFQYLSDQKCSKKERLLWVVVLTAAIYATVQMICDEFQHYYNNPIVYSHLAMRRLIKDIPFPAVTICSHNQIPPSAFDYSATLRKPKSQLSEKEGVRNDFCSEELIRVEWQRMMLMKPCDFLQQVLSWYGHCYTFNMVPFNQLYQPDYTYWYSSLFQLYKPPAPSFGGVLKTSEFYIEDDVSKPIDTLKWSEDLPEPPWSSNDSSLTGGVSFMLNFRSHDFDNTCSLGDKSFSVIIHPPDEVADYNHDVHIIRSNSMVLLKLFPEVFEHSPEFESIPPSRRGCYVNGEKILNFFQVYTERNCEVECHANLSMKHCGCVDFFHPREENTPVCNQARSKCLIEMQQNLREKCNCLPRCSFTRYNTERIFINKRKGFHPFLDMSMLFVTFPQKGVTTKVANTIWGKLNVLSNLGGLLSLFLGASVVSLMELAYMFTLRPLVTVWNYHKKYKRLKYPSTTDKWAQGANAVAWWH